MSANFANKNCVPCQEGTAPLEFSEMKKYLEELHSRWELSQSHTRLHCEIKTKDYKKAFHYATKISEMAEQQSHHPVITVGFGFLKVEIWTHQINGLAESDFIFSAKVDKILNDD